MMGCHPPPSHLFWLKGHETARSFGEKGREGAPLCDSVWTPLDIKLVYFSLGIHSTSLELF